MGAVKLQWLVEDELGRGRTQSRVEDGVSTLDPTPCTQVAQMVCLEVCVQQRMGGA